MVKWEVPSPGPTRGAGERDAFCGKWAGPAPSCAYDSGGLCPLTATLVLER
jgi:hypothetical protein